MANQVIAKTNGNVPISAANMAKGTCTSVFRPNGRGKCGAIDREKVAGWPTSVEKETKGMLQIIDYIIISRDERLRNLFRSLLDNNTERHTVV